MNSNTPKGSAPGFQNRSAAARRKKKRRKRIQQAAVILTGLLLLVAVGMGIGWATLRLDGSKALNGSLVTTIGGAAVKILAETPVPEDYRLEERSGVTYLTIRGQEMILVNKAYSIPPGYGDSLTAETQAAYNAMERAASDAGFSIYIVSGFRSYDTQAIIHSNYLNSGSYTYEYVKQMSAEAGHSEHQLGLAIDIGRTDGLYELSQHFDETPEWAWLNEHAAAYGFILRYPKGKTWATGYMYEPWHFRYVGPELAKILNDSGLTVEEYIGQPCP